MNNILEKRVLARIENVKSGAITEADRDVFFRMVTDLACRPLIRQARKEAGLPKFEKTHRRCVHPNGVHPRLAYLTEGEPEWKEHQRLLEVQEGIFQRMRLELCTGH